MGGDSKTLSCGYNNTLAYPGISLPLPWLLCHVVLRVADNFELNCSMRQAKNELLTAKIRTYYRIILKMPDISPMWVAVVCTSHLSNVLLPVAASPAGTCLHISFPKSPAVHVITADWAILTGCFRATFHLTCSVTFFPATQCDWAAQGLTRPPPGVFEESDHRTETLPWGLIGVVLRAKNVKNTSSKKFYKFKL